ncbi:MAG: hypothetical protein ACQESR_30480 [Planctomycetota bacterium]
MDYPPASQEVRILSDRHPDVPNERIKQIVQAANAVRQDENLGVDLSVRATDEVCLLLGHPNFADDLAVDALVEQGLDEVYRQLEEAARSGDAHVRIETAELSARLARLLAARPEKAVRSKLRQCQELLLSTLNRSTDQARAIALRGLADSGFHRVLPRACQLLRDPAVEVKLAAACDSIPADAEAHRRGGDQYWQGAGLPALDPSRVSDA